MTADLDKKYAVEYAVFTDPGTRPVNEDFCGVYASGGGICFVVCDGLGGHGMGDAASRSVVDSVLSLARERRMDKKFIPEALPQAQQQLLALQREQGASQKMKTTAVAAVTEGKKLFIGHIGDSRLYLFRKGGVALQTQDHSIPQMLVRSGEIKPSEIRHHPDRNLVMRVLGVPWEKEMLEMEKPQRISEGDTILLCTDGFWELIEETEMIEMLSAAPDMQTWLEMMSLRIRQNGENQSMDNFTAIAARFVKKTH
ncbi:MAG: serine/threonine-protein phosphatase [Lachnospiraceae bacterium]|nr:serine/threonine-protein phosphatase [Lachnospiraceae bacterium]